jgi:hypothetical protein
MSINNEYTPDIYYSDGKLLRYNFKFFIIKKDDLKVEIFNPTTNETKQLSFNVDYQVEDSFDYYKGGWMILNKPITLGQKIVIYRKLPYNQEINLLNLQQILPKNLTFMFDKLTAMVQEINSNVNRILKYNWQNNSLIEQELPLNENNIQNLWEENTRKEVAIILKYSESLGKWYLTTSLQSPDQQLVQGTEQHFGIYKIANQSEAEAGTDDLKVMTPLKTNQQIQAEFQRHKVTEQDMNNKSDVPRYINPTAWEYMHKQERATADDLVTLEDNYHYTNCKQVDTLIKTWISNNAPMIILDPQMDVYTEYLQGLTQEERNTYLNTQCLARKPELIPGYTLYDLGLQYTPEQGWYLWQLQIDGNWIDRGPREDVDVTAIHDGSILTLENLNPIAKTNLANDFAKRDLTNIDNQKFITAMESLITKAGTDWDLSQQIDGIKTIFDLPSDFIYSANSKYNLYYRGVRYFKGTEWRFDSDTQPTKLVWLVASPPGIQTLNSLVLTCFLQVNNLQTYQKKLTAQNGIEILNQDTDDTRIQLSNVTTTTTTSSGTNYKPTYMTGLTLNSKGQVTNIQKYTNDLNLFTDLFYRRITPIILNK